MLSNIACNFPDSSALLFGERLHSQSRTTDSSKQRLEELTPDVGVELERFVGVGSINVRDPLQKDLLNSLQRTDSESMVADVQTHPAARERLTIENALASLQCLEQDTGNVDHARIEVQAFLCCQCCCKESRHLKHGLVDVDLGRCLFLRKGECCRKEHAERPLRHALDLVQGVVGFYQLWNVLTTLLAELEHLRCNNGATKANLAAPLVRDIGRGAPVWCQPAIGVPDECVPYLRLFEDFQVAEINDKYKSVEDQLALSMSTRIKQVCCDLQKLRRTHERRKLREPRVEMLNDKRLRA